MKLPIKKSSIQSSRLNITYDELLKLDFNQLKDWIDEIKSELLKMWDEENIPPSIGKSESKIIKSFSKLKLYDLNRLWYEDNNYPDYLGFIKNFTKIGSSVNQWFPSMLKTKLKGKSMYDWFSNDELSIPFRRTMVRALRLDGLYSFSSYLKVKNGENHSKFFQKWVSELNGNTGYWLEPQKTPIPDENNPNLFLNTTDTKKLLKREILTSYDFRNSVEINGQDETYGYMVRTYDKSENIFPNIIQIFRLGLGQPPVNFSPLTSRFIYEKWLDDYDQEHFNIYDSSMGWGGRLLGSLSSNLNTHYIGTDPNSNNFGCYESLGNWYNSKCNGKNTFHIFRCGSEVIRNDKEFQKYKGELDLCFTSPPYFDTENYSDDETQSIHSFKTYKDWLSGFLNPTIKTCYDYLKPNRYMIINISDVKKNPSNYIPLEQDTISLALNNGFQYISKVGMVMSRSIGLNPKEVKNNWFDESTMKDYKIEPIFFFKKES